jgi:hypothetical protein
MPKDFDGLFHWDRATAEIGLVLFVNAADPLGVTIDGLLPDDLVQVWAMSGMATLKKDKGNPTASGIIGLVAAAAEIGGLIAGMPAAAIPAIEGCQ